MPDYLHGVESFEVIKGTKTVQQVRTAVIAIVGCAPEGPLQEPTLVLDDRDAALFGSAAITGLTSGFYIPAALDLLLEFGTGTIVVVNVFDPAKHVTSVQNSLHTFSSGKLSLGKRYVSSVVVKTQDGITVLVENTDYTVNSKIGEITVKSGGSLLPDSSVSVSYTYADSSKVTAADIIGDTDTLTGQRTGLQALQDVYNLFGFFPKLLIAPGYSTLRSVSVAMEALACKFKAIALLDAPVGTTFAEALKGRGPEGSINFFTSSGRDYLLYPHLTRFDLENNKDELIAYSIEMAGMIAKTDKEKGYWYSPSNKQMIGITGVETKITFQHNTPNCEANMLNAAGITTVLSGYGTGNRTWGNRLANFPSEAGIPTFISSRRIADVLEESLDMASFQYIDNHNIDIGAVQDILEQGNAFLRLLQGRGAIVGGSVFLEGVENPAEELANGTLTVSYEFTPVVPLERIRNKYTITNKYYGGI